jgi:hypothetical protein
LLGCIEHFFFGQPFGTLVVPHHFFEFRVGKFVWMFGTVYRDRRYGAGVNKLLDAGAFRCFQQIFGATNIGVVNVL